MSFEIVCGPGYAAPRQNHLDFINGHLPKLLAADPRLSNGDFKGILIFNMVSGRAEVDERKQMQHCHYSEYFDSDKEIKDFFRAIDRLDRTKTLPMLVCSSTWFDKPLEERDMHEKWWERPFFSSSFVLVTLPPAQEVAA